MAVTMKADAPANSGAPAHNPPSEAGNLKPRRAKNEAEAVKTVAQLFMGEGDSADATGAGDDVEHTPAERSDEPPVSKKKEENGDLYGDGVPFDDKAFYGDGDEDEGQVDAGKKGGKPKNLAEAAEALGMKPKDLYELELTTGDGEKVKIGDLKDAYQNRQAAERESVERATALDERETALFQQQRLFAELGDDLAKHLTPQKRQDMVDHLTAQDARERQRLMQAMPELQDRAAFDQFRDDVVRTLGRYGYKPHEVVVSDHRHLLIVRDLMRANKRIKSLLELPKDQQKPPKAQTPQGRGAGSQNKRKAKPNMRPARGGEEVRAVAALIKGS